jgi:hypothetical protein
LIAIEHGKLSYKAGRTKDSGKLVVVTFSVERLAAATPALSEIRGGDERPALG